MRRSTAFSASSARRATTPSARPRPTGKYPDGNQVIVQGAHDQRVAFDTPLVANRIGPDFDDVDLVILGHVHEDHMAGLHRVPHAAGAGAPRRPGRGAELGRPVAPLRLPAAVLAPMHDKLAPSSSTTRGPTPPATPTARCGTWAAAPACGHSTCPATPPATAH
jgi:glyoxylase-like metal-dependent hydrolase (beta-lactamase superfamily II)